MNLTEVGYFRLSLFRRLSLLPLMTATLDLGL